MALVNQYFSLTSLELELRAAGLRAGQDIELSGLLCGALGTFRCLKTRARAIVLGREIARRTILRCTSMSIVSSWYRLSFSASKPAVSLRRPKSRDTASKSHLELRCPPRLNSSEIYANGMQMKITLLVSPPLNGENLVAAPMRSLIFFYRKFLARPIFRAPAWGSELLLFQGKEGVFRS